TRDAGARAELVVWERDRPPQLGARGPLAIEPSARRVSPGDPLRVRLRVPGGAGRAWLTLEQGAVWSSAWAADGGEAATLAVPREAGGRATIVATHIGRGVVRTATAT